MDTRTKTVMLGVFGLASALLSCGGTSGSDTGGAAGAGGGSSGNSGTGGSSTGGSSAIGGSSAGGESTAGAAGSSTGKCVSGATEPPVAALITDFSDAMADPAHSGEYRFGGGMAARVQGGTTRFSNPASTKGSLALSGGALSFSATVSAPAASGVDQFPFNGFVLYIDGPACIDASAYSGVSFALSGSLGTCALNFAFAYADDLPATTDPNRGLCSGTCYPSVFTLTPSSTSVSFGATPTVLGMPVAAVDKAKLLGVQWQLQPSGSASCTANFTIDDITLQ